MSRFGHSKQPAIANPQLTQLTDSLRVYPVRHWSQVVEVEQLMQFEIVDEHREQVLPLRYKPALHMHLEPDSRNCEILSQEVHILPLVQLRQPGILTEQAEHKLLESIKKPPAQSVQVDESEQVTQLGIADEQDVQLLPLM